MATVHQLRERLQAVNIREIALELYEKHSKEFERANRKQLWNGKKADGTNITPSYSNDPYFKTRKQAEAYARWKFSGKYSQGTTRDKDTPNLYINGYFYSTIVLSVSEKPVLVVNDTFGSQVESGHPGILGVGRENLKEIAQKYFLPEFYDYLEKTTQLKFR